MDVLEKICNRRSVRKFTEEPISDEMLKNVLKVGLLAPSGKDIRPLEFVVIKDKTILEECAVCRNPGPVKHLANAAAAIVVLADENKSDVWIEDASIAMAYMHLEADSLGLGSCWVQLRLRNAAEGLSAEQFLRKKIGFPDNYKAEAILVLGNINDHPEARGEDRLVWSKVHQDQF